MKKVNSEELENIIRDYVNSTISKPLMVFGGHHQDARSQVIKKIFGKVNSYKISFKNDNPRPDIPYCIYDAYIGDDNSNDILRNCMDIAVKIQRPVFCLFDSSTKEKVPAEILSKLDILEYTE